MKRYSRYGLKSHVFVAWYYRRSRRSRLRDDQTDALAYLIEALQNLIEALQSG